MGNLQITPMVIIRLIAMELQIMVLKVSPKSTAVKPVNLEGFTRLSAEIPRSIERATSIREAAHVLRDGPCSELMAQMVSAGLLWDTTIEYAEWGCYASAIETDSDDREGISLRLDRLMDTTTVSIFVKFTPILGRQMMRNRGIEILRESDECYALDA